MVLILYAWCPYRKGNSDMEMDMQGGHRGIVRGGHRQAKGSALERIPSELQKGSAWSSPEIGLLTSARCRLLSLRCFVMAVLANYHTYLDPLGFRLELWFLWSEAPAVNHFPCLPWSLPKSSSPCDFSPGISFTSLRIQGVFSLRLSSRASFLVQLFFAVPPHSFTLPPTHSFPGSVTSQRLCQRSHVVWLTILSNAGRPRSAITQSMTCTARAPGRGGAWQ